VTICSGINIFFGMVGTLSQAGYSLKPPVTKEPCHFGDDITQTYGIDFGADMILTRIIRLRDAPSYLGMDKNRFNAEVRPCLHEKRMGKLGVAFDRLELDAWANRHFGGNGRAEQPEEIIWNAPNSPKAWRGEKGRTGRITKTSISKSSAAKGAFAALAERVIRKKRSPD